MHPPLHMQVCVMHHLRKLHYGACTQWESLLDLFEENYTTPHAHNENRYLTSRGNCTHWDSLLDLEGYRTSTSDVDVLPLSRCSFVGGALPVHRQAMLMYCLCRCNVMQNTLRNTGCSSLLWKTTTTHDTSHYSMIIYTQGTLSTPSAYIVLRSCFSYI